MKTILLSLLIFMNSFLVLGQEAIEIIDEIQLDQIESSQIKKYWLKMVDNGMNQPVYIPVMIAKGKSEKPVLGLTAAIHGNELNGIKIIQELMEEINVDSLEGTIIAVPGLNSVSIPLHQRRYIDDEDLNRNFPGKEKGNRSQQYAWQINQKILTQLDYLVDMHTASFGRVNSLYVRGDLSDPQIKKMSDLQNADIILNNKGIPSTGDNSAAQRTMRAEAVLKGIPTITVEYADPQVYQTEIINRGKIGVRNIMCWLKMIPGQEQIGPKAVICKKSYWLYVDQGGYLEIYPALNQMVEANELIGVLRNPFGDIIGEYFAPEKGIVIGKSSNPINMSGGRILHLGIMDNTN